MKSLLFLFLLCTCVPAIAMTPPEPLITRTVVEGDNVSLTIANLEKERTRIEILDVKSNQVIYGTTVKNHNGYRASFDLKKLDQGRYMVTVKKGDTVRKQIIRKTEVGIMCSDWN